MPIARFRGVSATAAERPTQARMQSLANELIRHGFQIVDIGRFAVTAEGESRLFEEVLGVTPQRGTGLRAQLHDELNGLADLVEIAPPPILAHVNQAPR